MGTEKQNFRIDPPDLPREDETAIRTIDKLSGSPLEAMQMATVLKDRYKWTFAEDFSPSNDDTGPFVMYSSDSTNMSYLISQEQKNGDVESAQNNQIETHTYIVGKGWNVEQSSSDEPSSAEVIPMDHAIIVGEVSAAIKCIPKECDNPLVHVRDFLCGHKKAWVINNDSSDNPTAQAIIVSVQGTPLKYYISYDPMSKKFTILQVQNVKGVDALA